LTTLLTVFTETPAWAATSRSRIAIFLTFRVYNDANNVVQRSG
jgi:hypothetical protein